MKDFLLPHGVHFQHMHALVQQLSKTLLVTLFVVIEKEYLTVYK